MSSATTSYRHTSRKTEFGVACLGLEIGACVVQIVAYQAEVFLLFSSKCNCLGDNVMYLFFSCEGVSGKEPRIFGFAISIRSAICLPLNDLLTNSLIDFRRSQCSSNIHCSIVMMPKCMRNLAKVCDRAPLSTNNVLPESFTLHYLVSRTTS